MSKFIKHEKGFFDQLIIKKLRSLPNGSDCVIVYQKLLELTLDTEGVIEFSSAELALILDEQLDIVEKTIKVLRESELVTTTNDSGLILTGSEDFINDFAKKINRLKMRRYRKNKQKNESVITCNYSVITSNNNVITSNYTVNSADEKKTLPEPTKTPDTSEVQGFEQTVIPEVSSISCARVKDLKDLKDLDLKNLKSKNLKPKTLKPKNPCARTRTRVDKNTTRDINLLEISKNVIGHLNKVAGTTFRHTTPSTLENIKKLLNDNYTQDDFLTVVDKMGHLWTVVRPEMHEFLRPSTLFGSRSKFDEYLNLVPGCKLTKSQKVALESMQNIAEIARVTDALEKSGLKFAPDNSERRPNDLSDFEDFFKNSFNQGSGIAC